MIRNETDAGITGYGEVDSLPPVVKAIIDAPPSHAIASGLRHLLLGENPLEIDRLWQKLYRGSIYYGRQGPAIHAISGIDIALWDIKGKALNQSVCSLLGGYRDRAPTYASGALMRPHPVNDELDSQLIATEALMLAVREDDADQWPKDRNPIRFTGAW